MKTMAGVLCAISLAAGHALADDWHEPDRIEIPHLTYTWTVDVPPNNEGWDQGDVVVEIDNLVLRKLRYSTMWSFAPGGSYKISGTHKAVTVFFECNESGLAIWSGQGQFSDRTSGVPPTVKLNRGDKSYEIQFNLPAHLHRQPTSAPCGTHTGPKMSLDQDTILTVALKGGALMTPPSGLQIDLETHRKQGPMQWSSSGKAKVPTVTVKLVPDTDVKSWVPEGPTPKKKEGNTFAFHIEILDEKGQKMPNPNVDQAVLTLEGTSAYPGICSNWPSVALPEYNLDPDLFFNAQYNKKGTIEDKAQTLKLGPFAWSSLIVVSSRDFGGHTTIRGKVTVDGVPLDAIYTGPGAPKFNLPLDADRNLMADAALAFQGLTPDLDDENVPVGKTRGDGIRAFDEYRGFLVSREGHLIPDSDEVYRRLDPKKRQLFVVLHTTPAYEDQLKTGVRTFETASQLEVVFVANKQRLLPLDNDEPMPRSVVLNADPPSKTAGVWITTLFPPEDDTPARAEGMAVQTTGSCGKGMNPDFCICNADPNACIGKPRLTRAVRVTVKTTNIHKVALDDFNPANTVNAEGQAMRDLWDANGYPAARRARIIPTVKTADLDVKTRVFTIAHELGHAVGMHHHPETPGLSRDPTVLQFDKAGGPIDCPERYWHYLLAPNAIGLADFFDGTWDPSVSSVQRKIYQFCVNNLRELDLQP